MNDRDDEAVRVAMRAQLAQLERLAAKHARPVSMYGIGGGVVALHAPATAAVERLLTALEPLRLSGVPRVAPDLDLHVWNAAEEPAARATDALFARGGLAEAALGGYSDAGTHAFYQPQSGALSAFDAKAGCAHWWLRDADDVQYYERAAPLKHILQWWMASLGGAVLHSAAIASGSGAGTDPCGVLIAGPSGSGKSSSALACLARGMGFTSDDYVIVEGGALPRVHMAYSTAKVVRKSLERFQVFKSHFDNLDRGDEKPMLFVHQFAPAAIRTSFLPVAIVLPRVAHRDRTVFAPMPAAAMLRALAPSSLMLLPFAGARAFGHIAALCKRLPCLRADLADDPDDVADEFARLVASRGVA